MRAPTTRGRWAPSQSSRSPDQMAGLGSRRAVHGRERGNQRRILSGEPFDDVAFGRRDPRHRERHGGRQRSAAEMNVVARRTAWRALVAGVVLVLGIVHRVGAERDELKEVPSDVSDARKLDDRNDGEQPEQRQHDGDPAAVQASSRSRGRGVRSGL